MLSLAFYANNRAKLQERLPEPILLMGCGLLARNLPMNHLPFRQDSSFLYFTGCAHPNSALLLVNGREILFLPKQDPADALWHGESPSNLNIAKSLGFEEVMALEDLEARVSAYESLHSLAVSDPFANQRLSKIHGKDFSFGKNHGSQKLVDATIQMRRILQSEEIESMLEAAKITGNAHVAAMMSTKIGRHERDVALAFHQKIAKAHLPTAYDSIVTVDGHILHNHHQRNTMADGQLLLLDGGAESAAGYATDVTRTWPVSGRFTAQQKVAYEAVLRANQESIQMVQKGVRYRDIHTHSSLVIADFLHQEGLTKLNATDAVDIGLHALFFPHGVGHLIGMDVHDLENFGDQAAYPPSRSRSEQFGTGYLRLDLDLEENMVVTIEPGFYIVPAILNNPKLREQFGQYIHWDAVKQWDGFGGIRIEDDVLCTHAEAENLTDDIPKTIMDIEFLVGSNLENIIQGNLST